MRFVFDEQKAAQAAAQLLRLHGGRMPYIKLIKLLYLADRESLMETGYPITGDRLVSVAHGPILGHVLDLMTRGTFSEDSYWPRYISAPDGYDVHLVSEADSDVLSEYELDLLRRVNGRFGHLEKWALVRYTQELAEWVEPHETSVPIDAQVILREAGKSSEEIQEIAAQAEAIWAFKTLAAMVR